MLNESNEKWIKCDGCVVFLLVFLFAPFAMNSHAPLLMPLSVEFSNELQDMMDRNLSELCMVK